MANFLFRIKQRQTEVSWERKLKDFVSGDGSRKRISDEILSLIKLIQDLASQSPVAITSELIDGVLSVRAKGVTVTGVVEDGGLDVGWQLVCRIRPIAGEGHDLAFARTLEQDGEPVWRDYAGHSQSTRQVADEILSCMVPYIDFT